MIRYIPANTSPMIFFDEERLPLENVYIAPETYSRRKELMTERFENMLHYANNESECRSMIIERYFGDENSSPCGVCDVCLKNRRKKPAAEIGEADILSAIDAGTATVKELVDEFRCESEIIITVIKRMLGDGRIAMDDEGRLFRR